MLIPMHFLSVYVLVSMSASSFAVPPYFSSFPQASFRWCFCALLYGGLLASLTRLQLDRWHTHKDTALGYRRARKIPFTGGLSFLFFHDPCCELAFSAVLS